MGNYVIKKNGYLVPYIGAELEDIEREPDGYLMSYKEYLAYKTQVSGFETEKYLIRQKCEREISDAYKALYESELENTKKQLRKELSQQQQYYIDKNEELRNTIAELNNEISLLTENCENLEKSKTSLDNLMRIKREQGNAARGIINKKQHHGYIIINSQEVEDRDFWEYNNKKTSWKSQFQTPYMVDCPYSSVRNQILSELNDIIMPELEVTAYSMDEEITKINENKFYKIRMSANYKTGFWEVTIYATQGLSIPASMLPSIMTSKMSSKDNRQK